MSGARHGAALPYAAAMAETPPEPDPAGPAAREPDLGVRRSRWRTLTAVLALGALVVVVVSWWMTHPAALPLREGHVTAVTTPGRAVYVGMVSGSEVPGTLRLGGVHVTTEATVPVEVEPLLCRGGSVSITADADPFCLDLVDPTGQQLRPGDSLVVRVTGEEAGAAYVSQLVLSYRSGLQVGDQPAGTRAVVAIVPPTS